MAKKFYQTSKIIHRPVLVNVTPTIEEPSQVEVVEEKVEEPKKEEAPKKKASKKAKTNTEEKVEVEEDNELKA